LWGSSAPQRFRQRPQARAVDRARCTQQVPLGRLAYKEARDFSHLSRQRGMFGFTGLSALQIEALRQDWGVYLIQNGRINIAGLNPQNMNYTVAAIANVTSENF
ncbi:aminotransferase class I/II-fold pyridoxal phosphate-dependent enzyme, partial [Uliginosibacterium flavum]